MTRSRLFVFVALCVSLVLAFALAGCSSSAPSTPVAPPASGGGSSAATAPVTPPPGHETVTIKDFQFTPVSLTVKVGTIVTWKNTGGTNHTVTFDDGKVDSGPIQPGTTASHVFSAAGTFAYHCSIHPTMKGTVIVTK